MDVFGLVLVLVGVFFLVVYVTGRRRMEGIRDAETSTARELADAAEYTASRLGERGCFSRITSVSGTIRCDSPLTSELSRQQCAYYSMQVCRECEDVYQHGGGRPRAHRRSEIVASNSQLVKFWVEDPTGRIQVDPEGAEIDPARVMDRFDYGYMHQGERPTGVDTLGYHLRESALPVGREVYVLGEATDASGELLLRQPRQGRGQFIISVRSKAELLREAEREVRQHLKRALTLGGVGLLLVLLPF